NGLTAVAIGDVLSGAWRPPVYSSPPSAKGQPATPGRKFVTPKRTGTGPGDTNDNFVPKPTVTPSPYTPKTPYKPASNLSPYTPASNRAPHRPYAPKPAYKPASNLAMNTPVSAKGKDFPSSPYVPPKKKEEAAVRLPPPLTLAEFFPQPASTGTPVPLTQTTSTPSWANTPKKGTSPPRNIGPRTPSPSTPQP